ncbi:HAMP domain-containing sensor histidine kinase [Sediminicoccus sp. KRV36]|uniref:sensor histidine kinase n=1 Tax=Sediminicoccus sp. KRV36 TaxID=3133721 RepID=UPI00200ECC3C|nr:HAMP domain-containing sensor histidine kinase [Sediminicoccus rosea]UPY37352.1 HAMP domain-containing histidine kinase [Sediminicoccus rosea]
MIRRSSFALRAATASAVVMLVLSLLGSGWGWLRAEAALRQQLDLAIAAEADGFLREYEEFGLRGLAVAVEAYARRRGPLFVALLAPDGRPIAGRLPAAPPALRGFANLPGTGERPSLRVLGGHLPGGATLLVAADLTPVDQAASALAWTPPIAGGAAALLALLLGFIAAARMERRLAGAAGAALGVMEGDLTRRLPLSGRGDEFDRLTATFNALLGRIEALMLAQRQVTDDIAHDLRSPLSRLRQLLEGALAEPRDPERDAEMLEHALLELDSVLASFAALLRIARAESGVLREGFSAMDLSALVTACGEAMAPVAEEAGHVLNTAIAPGVTLRGDAALLRQAVVNLIENAILHGGPNIMLQLRPGPVIEVEDDGPGIPQSELAAVIRRFHRLDRSRSTPGTGLGLALVAAAAKAHGGALRLGAGTGGRGLRAQLDLTPGP